jgi:hypothetical protein
MSLYVSPFCLVPFISLYVSPFFSSLLGFISSLPNLLGTKGYVVVVIVVVVIALNSLWRA